MSELDVIVAGARHGHFQVLPFQHKISVLPVLVPPTAQASARTWRPRQTGRRWG